MRAAETLIPAGAIWRYSATGAEPDPAWATFEFDDGAWPAGAAQLGFGDGDETTVLDGAPGGVRLITAYFRRAFDFTMPATNLVLRLRRDDGALVYLNGAEIHRDNMAPGPVTYSTLASTLAIDDGNTFIITSLPTTYLRPGANVLAVEVHQVNVSSSDLSFDLELLAETGGDPVIPTVTVDDHNWKSGPAQLGYGDGDEVTVVESGPVQAKYITTYFRRAFAVVNAAAVSDLSLRLLRDDGGVVYLNGVEVFRSNMPPGPVNWATLASVAIGEPEETTEFVAATLPGGLLREGPNVVAVEIHQVNPTSSDLSFDLELVGRGAGTVGNLPPGVEWVSPARRSMFTAPTNITLVAQAFDSDGRVTRVEFFAIDFVGGVYQTNRVGTAIEGSSPGMFSVIWTNPAPHGLYSVYAQAFDDRDASARSDPNMVLAVVNYPVPPTVSLQAVDADASERGGNPGLFRVSRTTPGDNPLTVYFDVGGSAEGGVDYAALNTPGDVSHVVIPAHATEVAIAIQPLEDDLFEGVEEITLSLRELPPGYIPSFPIPADGYFLAAGATTATVSIADQDSPDSDRELHAVGIYSGITSAGTTSHQNEPGEAAVVVRRPGHHVTLVLNAYEPVLWHVAVDPSTVIERIILAGYYRQSVTGVAADVEQIPAYFTHGGGSFSLGTDSRSGEFQLGKRTLCAMVGLDLSSFQGASAAPYPAPFIVDHVQDDPVLRCDYPRVTSPEDLPSLRFEIPFQLAGATGSVQRIAYSLSGPENAARLFPGLRLAADGGGRYFYGVGWGDPFRIDAPAGTVESLPLGVELPPLSWPTGLAYDSQRDRVLMVSFGGEGFLYSYSPSQGRWSLVSDLNNHDLDGIVYHAEEDVLYGVAMTFGGPGPLIVKRFSPGGTYLGAIPLPVPPFSIGLNAHRTHLVSVDSYLVLLIEPDQIYPTANQLQESRIYLIDPVSGQSWLTYRQIHAPLPQGPLAQMIWPGEGLPLPNTVPVPLVAEASDPDGLVRTVEFRVDEVSVGFGRRDPDASRFSLFRLDWPNPSLGQHRVTARATDGEGYETISSTVNFVVVEGSPEPDPSDELHAVGVISGSTLAGGPASGTTGHAAVLVDRPGKRVTLLLSAQDSVQWHVSVAPGTLLTSVILGGYDPQSVTGLAPAVSVIPAYYGDGSRGSDYLDTGFEVGTAKFQTALTRLCQRAGVGLSSFQGTVLAPYPAPFLIDRVQLDARLRCDYPRPVAPDRLPALSFRLAFAEQGGHRPFFQDYTLAGAINAVRLLPGTRVVTDAQERYYYGEESHEMFRIDALTGERISMDLGPEVPELSWPIGVTYDSAYERVLLASLGGDGYLYAYSPAQDQWSLLHSFAGLDLATVTYHHADGSLYGVTASFGDGGVASLQRFAADGEWLGSSPLPALPVSLGISGARSELASVGDYLIWLVEWDEHIYPSPPAPESRIYLIDPRTGQVSLTFRGVPLPDQDGDGVPDGQDQCPGSGGAIVDARGCSLAQLCPCSGDWGSRRDYVRCAIERAWQFYRAGLISAEARRAFIHQAVRSGCGRDETLELQVQPQNGPEIVQDGRCLIVTGATDLACVLECSTDFKRWTPIQTNPAPALEVEIVDFGAAQAPARFYRVRQAQ